MPQAALFKSLLDRAKANCFPLKVIKSRDTQVVTPLVSCCSDFVKWAQIDQLLLTFLPFDSNCKQCLNSSNYAVFHKTNAQIVEVIVQHFGKYTNAVSGRELGKLRSAAS